MATARPSRLDPAVAALIKALARGDAERDFKAAMDREKKRESQTIPL